MPLFLREEGKGWVDCSCDQVVGGCLDLNTTPEASNV